MKKFYLLALVFISLLGVSCSNKDCSTFDLDTYYLQENTDYKFIMMSEQNSPIADGYINVTTRDRFNISGSCSVIKIYVDTVPGLSSIKGNFSAKEADDDNRVLLNTNPKISDGNIYFDFRLDKNNIKGEWYFSSLKGKTSTGKLSGYKVSFRK